jgi:hypothetical protein
MLIQSYLLFVKIRRRLKSTICTFPILILQLYVNRQTSGESASLPQYLGCNTVFDMRLRVPFLRRKTVSLQSNIAHRE